MKNLLIFFFMCSVVSFSVVNDNKFHAEVDREEGFYLYVDSKPISDYKYLGSVSSNLALTGKHKHVKQRIINNAKRKFPQGNALIFTDEGFNADVVLIE